MSLVPFSRRSRAPVFSTGFEEFDRMFDGLLRNALTNISVPAASLTDMAVRMDVGETETAYHVRTDLPGVEDKDVEITLTDGILTIAGEKKQETEEEGKTFHRIERSYGSFRRTLSLPADASENDIKASMKNGVLEIEIGKAKQPEKTVKKINIQSR